MFRPNAFFRLSQRIRFGSKRILSQQITLTDKRRCVDEEYGTLSALLGNTSYVV
jgi:hypothetical protein